MLGVKSITFKDIIHSLILPAFRSDQACELPPSLLVSYWAFISLSGLLNTSKADARGPDTADGRKLLKQLQQCAVVCTNKGPMRVGRGVAIHVPVSLGNQVEFKLHLCLLHAAEGQVQLLLCSRNAVHRIVWMCSVQRADKTAQ